MKVALLFNQPVLAGDHAEAESEKWVATAVDDIRQVLTAVGFQVQPVSVDGNLAALQHHLAACRPDVVFNLFEGFANRPTSEIAVAKLLERLQLPFTGCPSQ